MKQSETITTQSIDVPLATVRAGAFIVHLLPSPSGLIAYHVVADASGAQREVPGLPPGWYRGVDAEGSPAIYDATGTAQPIAWGCATIEVPTCS